MANFKLYIISSSGLIDCYNFEYHHNKKKKQPWKLTTIISSSAQLSLRTDEHHRKRQCFGGQAAKSHCRQIRSTRRNEKLRFGKTGVDKKKKSVTNHSAQCVSRRCELQRTHDRGYRPRSNFLMMMMMMDGGLPSHLIIIECRNFRCLHLLCRPFTFSASVRLCSENPTNRSPHPQYCEIKLLNPLVIDPGLPSRSG